MKNQVTITLLANVIHAATATLATTAANSETTGIRSSSKRMGQTMALRDSVAIEIKNHLTTGRI